MELNVTSTMSGARSENTDAAFQGAAFALSEAKNAVREEMQAKTAPQIKSIISKLKSEKEISSEEIELVKAWIVGDADAYVEMENSFDEWVEEYEALEELIRTYEKKDYSAEDLFNLHGILEDAIRVSYDIANFLEKKERIEKFDASVSDGLDKDERDILVRFLIHKLDSENA